MINMINVAIMLQKKNKDDGQRLQYIFVYSTMKLPQLFNNYYKQSI